MILQRLTERHVPGRIKVSDAEIDLGIRDRQATQTNVADVELAHILIAVPENANASEVAALQSKANSVLARLKAGAGFAEVAKEMSDSAESDKGGLMGVRPFDRYPSLFVEATQALRVGDLSAVISSGAGFHILKLVSKRNNNVMTVTETRVRHILLRPSSQLSQAAARAQLAEYRRLVDSGRADFAKLAVDHSQDASASNGGDLGWVGPGMFVPEFEQAMRQLAIGQISDPTVSRFGVHLIQVLARRDAALSEREMRDIVRNSLRDKKFDETYQLWVQEVRGRAYVEYRDPPL
jgi:peptidyl-prolyl cis-trans isomerase SurA